MTDGRVRVLVRFWVGTILLGLSLGSCGGGSAGAGDARSSGAEEGECLDASGPSLCDALVGHFSRCGGADAERQHLEEDCLATWGDFSGRANGCFVKQLTECLAGPCEAADSERCFREATVAADPGSFDRQAAAACTSKGECQGLSDGWVGRCVQRFDQCSADRFLCSTAASLKRGYRQNLETCFSRDCGTLEDCVYSAMGYP
jgi:hypothetical protein